MSAYRIPLANDTIGKDELQALAQWIQQDNRLTKGPLTSQFEETFARFTGSKHAVFVNSGSSANLLALYAAMQSGKMASGPVVVPAVSWVTTVTPAMQFGCEVILCDCHPEHLGLDLDHLRNTVQASSAFGGVCSPCTRPSRRNGGARRPMQDP